MPPGRPATPGGRDRKSDGPEEQAITHQPTVKSSCHHCGALPTAGPDPRRPNNYLCVACASVASLIIPARPHRTSPVPESLPQSPAWPITQYVTQDDQLWNHQALALQVLANYENLVISTSTASGKSLIFQFWTLHRLWAEPNTTAVIFYPTKALANDQTHRWRECCHTLGLPPTTVGQIDGDVPTGQRDAIIRQARIVIMTPDVSHAWLLRNANSPAIRTFLAGLTLIIIDEAHVYEGVFGSQAALFFRRLTSATLSSGNVAVPQYIGATATILEPGLHLEKLTGQPFQVIAEDDNGSPRHPRTLYHLPVTPQTTSREQQLAFLITSIIDADPKAQVIAFCDTRQGVERVVQMVDRPDQVLPYRSGYLPKDRRAIEDRLRNNAIRAVVATSALELGIDMPDLDYGINLGLPPSRKQFHQRLGRVGRSQPGRFIILTSEEEFASFGESIQQYYENSVEPSHLYLDNDYIKFQQALCLKAELEKAGEDTRIPPKHCHWPQEFDLALRYAHGQPPPHLEVLNRQVGRASPHHAFGLRNSGEEEIEIIPLDSDGQDETNIGKINVPQAMKEAYPGAIYRHYGKPYRVQRWGRRRDNQAVMKTTHIEPTAARTDPVLRQVITTKTRPDQDLNRRQKNGPGGSATQSLVTVTESVEGFRERSQGGNRDDRVYFYQDLKDQDPNKTRKQHQFPTTAVHLRIDQPWFSGDAGEPWQARELLSQALRRHLAYQKSIAPADLGCTVENIIIPTPRGDHVSPRSIVIYDNIYGGLGLVHDLYSDLYRYAKQLTIGSSQNADSAFLEYAHHFFRWVEGLRDNRQDEHPDPDEQDWWRIIRPKSRISVFSAKLERMTEAEVLDTNWQDGVVYEVDTGHEIVQARDQQLGTDGQNWDWLLWQPATGHHRELLTN